MSLEARLDKIEDTLNRLGVNQDHPHIILVELINGKYYSSDGTEFVNNHPKDCPLEQIVINYGEEVYALPIEQL